MHLADRRSAGILVAAVALAVIVAACSPNPRGTAGVSSPPPLPSSSPAWSRLDWTEAGQLTQFGIDARIAALAARDGLVLAAGTTGSSPVSGLVLLTRDGRGWERVRDVDVDGTAIVDAVAGADGFVIAGTDVDGPGLTGAVLGSADGLAWERLASLPGTRVRRLAAGPHGYVVLGDDGAGKAVVLWSRDARRWEAAGAQAFGSATVADIAATEDGWVAVGAAAGRARAWTSTDGRSWDEAPMDGAEPVSGIASVAVRAVTRAGTGLMALGTDDPPCEGDPEWCPHFGAAWWSVDGAHWLRLPTDGPLGQWGQRVFAVGDAGFVILDGSAVLLSTDGYQWDEVPTNGPAPRYLHVDRAVLAGDLFVVAGSWIAEEPTTLGVGAARVRR
jgi:hypothetical protein